MGTSQQIVYEFNGSLLSLTGGGLLDASLLNSGSGGLSATIRDDDGVLNQADDFTSLFSLNDGSLTDQPIDYIGSGTMSTISLLGITLDARPVTAFSVNGQIYLIAPNGFPLLSGLSISFDIDPNAGYTLPGFVPCLAEGTLIKTPLGYVPIEKLDVGDRVLDQSGAAHEILWRGSRYVPVAPKTAPVSVPRNFFGLGVPFTETRVSQQHRIAVHFPEFEEDQRFVRAKLLLEDGLSLDESMTQVTYHHLLFAEHIILIANGMPTESLLIAEGSRQAFGPETWATIMSAYEARTGRSDMAIALPEIGRGELQKRRSKHAKTRKALTSKYLGAFQQISFKHQRILKSPKAAHHNLRY